MRPLALLLFLAGLAALPAAAQRCSTALADAEGAYRSGAFDSAIARLDPCLAGTALSPEERSQAYRLIGLSYIGKDREAEARDAVRALLDVAPDYRPDPALDPPPYVALVEDVRRSRPRPRRASASRAASTAPGLSVAVRGQGTSYNEDGASATGGGGDLVLGYSVTPGLQATLRLDGSRLEGGFTLASVGLGGRFLVGGGRQRLVPFVGAGATFQSLSYQQGGVSVSATGPGGEVEGGLLYFVSPSLAVDAGVGAQFTALSNSSLNIDGAAATIRVGLGLRWQP